MMIDEAVRADTSNVQEEALSLGRSIFKKKF
jgi:hypothetical protein